MEFQSEIILLHRVNMEFHFEIVLSHSVNIEFHSEIALSHSANIEFHSEITLLHCVEMEFRKNTASFFIGKPPACPRNALLPERKSPTRNRRPPFGCPICHPAPQPTVQSVGKGIPYFFKSS